MTDTVTRNNVRQGLWLFLVLRCIKHSVTTHNFWSVT